MEIITLNKNYFLNKKTTNIFVEIIYKNFVYLAKYPNLKHNHEEIYRLLTKSDNFRGFLLRERISGKLVGYVLGESTRLNDGRFVFFISYIYVSEQHRKHGYASKLLNLIIDMASKYKLDGIVIVCDTHNDQVYRFYKKRGFNYDMIMRRYERYDVLSLLF